LTALGDPSADSNPSRATLPPAQANRAASLNPDIIVFIGPEGGFTAAEREQLASHGAKFMRLASPTLRVETAAVAVAALWAEWSCRS
jgi:RsmE family RNA methyltransferase